MTFIDASSLHLVIINPMSHKICYLLPNDSLSQEGLAVKLSAGLLSLTFSEMPELKIIAIRAGHARRGQGGSWHLGDNRGYILSSPRALGLVVSQESLYTQVNFNRQVFLPY